MQISLRMNKNSEDALNFFNQSFVEELVWITKMVPHYATEEFLEDIRRNFAEEGMHGEPWAELSDVTAEDRMFLGFPPYNPILYRTGSLLSELVDYPVIETEDSGTGNVKVRLGTDDYRFEELQMGRDDMLPRPMVPDTAYDVEITCTLIEARLKEFLDQEAEVIFYV